VNVTSQLWKKFVINSCVSVSYIDLVVCEKNQAYLRLSYESEITFDLIPNRKGEGVQTTGYNKKNATSYAEPLALRPPAASIHLCFDAFSSSGNQKLNKTTFWLNWKRGRIIGKYQNRMVFISIVFLHWIKPIPFIMRWMGDFYGSWFLHLVKSPMLVHQTIYFSKW